MRFSGVVPVANGRASGSNVMPPGIPPVSVVVVVVWEAAVVLPVSLTSASVPPRCSMGMAALVPVSLHVPVPDVIWQTCHDAAVLSAGQVIYTGTVAGLAQTAEGATWEVCTDGVPPTDGVVVSAVSRADGTQYRVVSPVRPGPDATPVRPTLEDGYIALMRRHAATPPDERPSRQRAARP